MTQGRVWLDATGIVCVDPGRQVRLTREVMQRLVALHRALSMERRPVLFYGDGVVRYDTDATFYLAEPEVREVTAAVALIGTRFLARHLSKLFLWYHKPPYPVQAFEREEAAIAWLFTHLPASGHLR